VLPALLGLSPHFSQNDSLLRFWGRHPIGASRMLKQVFVAYVFVVIASTATEARQYRTASQAVDCNVTMPCDFSFSQSHRKRLVSHKERQIRSNRRPDARQVAAVSVGRGQIIGGRPAGCPHSFCGCGASLKVFGRIVPGLNLAANWLRFPRTSPAPGMVAARRGHVFVLEKHIGGDTWMAYDANSGGRATRIHARSLRGYTVVNPHA
jgi:hypothetical protein